MPRFEDMLVDDPDVIRYAEFGHRLLAALIDVAVLVAAWLAILVPIALIYPGFAQEQGSLQARDRAIYFGVCLFTTWLYKAGLESAIGQATLGKRILRIYVAGERGDRISLARASFRAWPWYLLVFLPVSAALLVPVVFTRRKQGLHDMMAKCIVVRQRF